MIEGKAWGRTELIFKGPNFEVHRINVIAGGYCSKHIHATKYNLFYVDQGNLEIQVWKKNYNLIDSTLLSPGEKMKVPPGEYHRFKAVSDVIAYEIYYTELDSDDIKREDVGGGTPGITETITKEEIDDFIANELEANKGKNNV